MSNVVSQREKVFNALVRSNGGLTIAQINSQTGACGRNEIRRLRAQGMPIVRERRVNSKGEAKSFYKLSFSGLPQYYN